ncbi:hydroxyethylthiazole kinase [Rhizobiaceae bacterium BDR2-2]|uniref:Hydroxyethylthiazole kinase n=1 Tax=Ectorhizobium quercum TaxID=2965071 RepID=A0AAE3SUP8_9HYPH|nr:hydroxyethylthiazole kinase [Ectorhizobium quercum]MCX8996923.1 hydroxyethylthiazole kinase [Ectorhizobium quercum]
MTIPSELHTTPGAALTAMRAARPLVHCITNYVAMNVAANTLLAAGASPAMIHTPEEAGDFARIAAALTVNIGTLSPHWVEGMKRAAESANEAATPWVFDPVAHFATAYRAGVTAELLALAPAVIRGNASEIIGLSGGGSAARGPDAADPVDAAEAAARALAAGQKAVVAVTGETDFVTDGFRAVRIHGGSPLMPQVTALGCSLTCLVGAFAATTQDAFEATVAALAFYAVAGETAAERADGPGSFGWRFSDALAALTPEELDARARIDAA